MIRFIQMSSDITVRRLRLLSSAFSHGRSSNVTRVFCSSAGDDQFVNIGDVSIKVSKPQNPHLVPSKYLGSVNDLSQSTLKHLRWIMQKDLLVQDVFLIGPPGPFRRSVAMMYSELTKKEVEYVSLSRDTTETDLKQRREIKSGTAFYIDQSAVRAATEGRLLVLEGIEKAERNVLPVLNNLLENREMQLDDGRFLMAADRYDKLLQDHSQEELDAWKLVRVSDKFRVIALGLPVPRYQGNPLDPPLRSRFQARDLNPLPFKEQMEVLQAEGTNVETDKLAQMLSFANTLCSTEANELGMPDFPLDNLHKLAHLQSAIPQVSSQKLLEMLYPHQAMLGKEGQTAVTDAFKSFGLLEQHKSAVQVEEVRRSPEGAQVTLQVGRSRNTLQVQSGSVDASSLSGFVSTAYHEELLADMMMSHSVHDFCVIGQRGCGKTVLAKQFADLLGYHTETIMLYQDMSSRDLLQQRMTLPNGDTTWRYSPLVTAALEGSLAILDGIHRVNPGTFAVLHRLIHDRELMLFDGTRLLRADRYDNIKEELQATDEEMKARGVLRIHPSFRLLGLAEPPVLGSSNQQWLTPELLTMFLYHHMRSLTREEEIRLLHTQVSNMSKMEPLIALTHKLRLSHDTNLQSVATSLSTRQLLRIARRMAAYPQEDLHSTVYKACLARFLPRLARSGLDTELEQHSIVKSEVTKDVESLDKDYSCEVRDGRLRIGQTEVDVYQPDTLMKVPDVLFYENPQHMSVMEDMLKDFLLGEHLLLVGNQGVGKNKIVDRFLHLLCRPREYLQLHRDTTVQTLTLQPTVKEGVIVYEDSPLVRAVSKGYILVVDEADKAPTNVTCILKTLVESGEMHLSDGRRIVHANSGLQPSPSVLVCHPDFRMIVLANRPGFPFLGNDFFGAMGDIFSCHAVDNPDTESEIAMLKRYGPAVPDEVLRRLVLTFSELRDLADQGMINYPYSTREVVNMVKHLQKFPEEGLASVVRNVFDFDSYNKELTETIVTTLHKHGIPVGADPRNVHLAKEFPLPPCQFRGEWQLRTKNTTPLPVTHKQIRIKGPLLLPVQSFPLDRSEARSLLFTEQEAFWNIPLHETSVISDVAVTKGSHRQPGSLQGDIIHMATISPISLYSMEPRSASLSCIDLYDMFPTTRMSQFRPKLHIAPLGFPLDTRVLVHEQLTNTLLEVNYEFGEVRRVDLSSMVEAATESLARNFRTHQGTFRMCADFCHEQDGLVLFYKQEGNSIDVVQMLEGRCHSISLPLKIQDIHMMSRHNWLLTELTTHKKFILSNTEQNQFEYKLEEADDKSDLNITSLDVCGGVGMHESHLSAVLGHKITSPNRLLSDPYNYYVVGVGLPELSTVELHGCARKEHKQVDIPDRFREYIQAPRSKLRARDPVVYLPDSSQVVRGVPDYQVPMDLFPDGKRPKYVSGFLEVTDPVSKTVRYIPVPGATNTNIYHQWYTSASDVNIVLAGMSNDGVVTVDTGGCMRLWETALINLDKSMAQWRGLIGEGEMGRLQVTFDKEELGKDVTGPKHGRVDPTGAPHVGGNQWAGGTGGRDTAGLGGVGGPYRLDAGHDVTQVSQVEKDRVPEEVLKAAREMGQKAFKERLRQIQMSEYDGQLYEQYSKSVRGQVKSLRVILDNLQAKGKERQWLKHQTYGDLDDAKLIEGLTGERSIYKRRGEKEPEPGSPQQKPKLIKLLCDVSGSMYRFNGHDGRLDRQLEAMLMVMEAFESYEHKIKYDIVGHSGEGYKFDMVKQDKPPKNNKERLDIVKTLHAHAQFCISGDSTLEAAKHAITTITEQEADEHFVIVLSDANLERYGIRPKNLADILNSNEDVNAYVIFIGSLGDQANRLLKQLPSGKAFICMDTKNLPNILQQIFTSTILSSG